MYIQNESVRGHTNQNKIKIIISKDFIMNMDKFVFSVFMVQ